VLATIAHDHWQWENMISNTSMMKIVLVLVGGLAIYANVMYIRAELVYKEKRGNQRIKDEPDESLKKVKKLAKQSKKGKGDVTVVLGESRENDGYPVVMKGDDLFVHSLFVGSTGSGKTASVLEPTAFQMLVQKNKGKKLGLTVVEPKRDFVLQVKEYCEEMEIPYTFIDPLSEDSAQFNPMEGEKNQVAEATVIALQALFGKQEPFFEAIQELSTRNVTMLLKELKGDDLDITDVMNTLRDPEELQKKVTELEIRDGLTDLVHFFKEELLSKQADKYRQFVMGLRAQMENITSNELLRKIMTGESDVDINKHFSEGRVLIVNTELGALGKSGNVFGQFLMLHLQNGTFNRPGPKKSRIPHYMIIDEYSLYINSQIERFLSVARSYKVAGIFATQSLAQLEVETGNRSGHAIKQAILTNCRNQAVFGGVSSEDAKQFAEEFGRDKVLMRQATYKHRIFMPVLFPESYRDTETDEYRFDPTDIMTELKKYTFIHKLMFDNQVQKPEIAKGNLVPENWKKQIIWEKTYFLEKLKNILAGTIQYLKNTMKRTISQKALVNQGNEQATQVGKSAGPVPGPINGFQNSKKSSQSIKEDVETVETTEEESEDEDEDTEGSRGGEEIKDVSLQPDSDKKIQDGEEHTNKIDLELIENNDLQPEEQQEETKDNSNSIQPEDYEDEDTEGTNVYPAQQEENQEQEQNKNEKDDEEAIPFHLKEYEF